MYLISLTDPEQLFPIIFEPFSFNYYQPANTQPCFKFFDHCVEVLEETVEFVQLFDSLVNCVKGHQPNLQVLDLEKELGGNEHRFSRQLLERKAAMKFMAMIYPIGSIYPIHQNPNCRNRTEDGFQKVESLKPCICLRLFHR